jgi:hypothetical protein
LGSSDAEQDCDRERACRALHSAATGAGRRPGRCRHTHLVGGNGRDQLLEDLRSQRRDRFHLWGAPCVGKYKLTGIEHLYGKTPTAVDAKAKKRPKERTVGLSRGRYSIKAGTGKAITVKLNRTGVKLLRKLHKISGQLTLTPTGATKPALIKTLKFK